ncbi:hypothetical protein GCM10023093_30830 [Nemorincola caseinilytica]|uniref:SGNH/GDSL hydrolase family protein n=1 Tax=Nemorincola caseinilytica TaxID=2054315 RepID=A0ABP8NS56_9BACT
MYGKAIWKVMLFVSPVLALLIAAEVYCRTHIAAVTRMAYVQKHAATIEILILGDSHAQDAIDPAALGNPAATLALGGQPLHVDQLLLLRVIGKLPRLRTVVIEVSPHRFYYDLQPDSWNTNMYHALYGIDYMSPGAALAHHSLVAADTRQCLMLFFHSFAGHGLPASISRLGFMWVDTGTRFSHLHYDTARIDTSFHMKHTFRAADGPAINLQRLQGIIELCQGRGVNIVLVCAPVYRTYLRQLPPSARARVSRALSDMAAKYHLRYIDHLTDTTYAVHHFRDDDHLNATGAARFTAMLREEMELNR